MKTILFSIFLYLCDENNSLLNADIFCDKNKPLHNLNIFRDKDNDVQKFYKSGELQYLNPKL
jgi:hypothetical protein